MIRVFEQRTQYKTFLRIVKHFLCTQCFYSFSYNNKRNLVKLLFINERIKTSNFKMNSYMCVTYLNEEYIIPKEYSKSIYSGSI